MIEDALNARYQNIENLRKSGVVVSLSEYNNLKIEIKKLKDLLISKRKERLLNGTRGSR